MACCHVGPCGPGCDGYPYLPNQPQPVAPLVFHVPMPSYPDKESAALEGWAGALKEVNRLNEELRLKDLQVDEYKRAEALRLSMLGTVENFAIVQNERYRKALETIRGGAFHRNCDDTGDGDGCGCAEAWAAQALAPQKECQCPTFPHRDDCALKRKCEHDWELVKSHGPWPESNRCKKCGVSE